jgi:hypothetical protein
MRKSNLVLLAAIVVTALAVAAPAHAQGASVDPNGFFGWFADLFGFGDAGARIDGNG